MTMVPDWLTKRIALTPHRTALEIVNSDGARALTWQALGGLVAQTMATLRAAGVQAGDPVAVLMGNGLPFVLATHALIQLRALLVPLNRRLTTAELAWQLRDVRATLLLTDEAHSDEGARAAAEAGGIPTLTVREEAEGHDPFPPTPLLSLADPHSILYTSGTTGNPKGVVLSYGNHWWSAMGSALNLGLREDDRWLLTLPLFHVGGLSMLFKSVIYGCTVQLHERFDAEAVNRALDEEGITHLSLVATMLRRLLDARRDTPFPPTLRAVLLGGAPCPEPLLERCARLRVPVVQTYGMTETSSQAVTLAPQEALLKVGSAGKPLFMCEIRIEQEEQAAAPGEIGEILVRGANVTTGYFNQPDATARTLRNGWLHTGDLGYLDDEGYLYVVSRRTDLIISGGENVYPAEIEAALLNHPAVAEAAVIGLPDDEWGQQGAAAVVLMEGETVTETELRAFAEARLARYKVPRRWLFTVELPRNAGGKVLRQEVARLFGG